MPIADPGLPAGFIRFTTQRATVVCAAHVERALRVALDGGTLHEFAARQPGARPLAGRGVAFAASLPDAVERVVVRRNRHGGWFATLTGDLFAPPTRAPHELEVAEHLRARHVPTPRMLGYVLYPAGPFRRVDVMTREVAPSVDLSSALMSRDAPARANALAASAALVRSLSDAGARHRDLNIKNILLHEPPSGRVEALVLDVDRVTFGLDPSDALAANLTRLLRSARKWRTERGAQVTADELEAFTVLARAPDVASPITLS
jgi:hypothetical protein